MTGSSPHIDPSTFASALILQSVLPTVLIAAALIATPLVAADLASHFDQDAVSCAASIAAMVAGLATIAVSMLLLFDALLFRLMATYRDDAIAGAAVDDLLARMRLKQRPARTRSVAERVAGTKRLIARQRLALAAFLVLSSIAVLDLRF